MANSAAMTDAGGDRGEHRMRDRRHALGLAQQPGEARAPRRRRRRRRRPRRRGRGSRTRRCRRSGKSGVGAVDRGEHEVAGGAGDSAGEQHPAGEVTPVRHLEGEHRAGGRRLEDRRHAGRRTGDDQRPAVAAAEPPREPPLDAGSRTSPRRTATGPRDPSARRIRAWRRRRRCARRTPASRAGASGSWKACRYSSAVDGETPPPMSRRAANATSRPTPGSIAKQPRRQLGRPGRTGRRRPRGRTRRREAGHRTDERGEQHDAMRDVAATLRSCSRPAAAARSARRCSCPPNVHASCGGSPAASANATAPRPPAARSSAGIRSTMARISARRTSVTASTNVRPCADREIVVSRRFERSTARRTRLRSTSRSHSRVAVEGGCRAPRQVRRPAWSFAANTTSARYCGRVTSAAAAAANGPRQRPTPATQSAGLR